jgi:hypothetical protein
MPKRRKGPTTVPPRLLPPKKTRSARTTSRPTWLDDLTFEEAVKAVNALVTAELDSKQSDYVLALFDVNLPGSNLSDLVFWPNEWFGDEAMLHVQLSAEQLVGYAMARAGRTLSGAPEIELPHPLPTPVERPPTDPPPDTTQPAPPAYLTPQKPDPDP